MQTDLLNTVVERGIDGRRLLYQVITCRKCGKEERFVVHTAKRLHPPEVLKKRSQRLGWTLTDKLKDAVCPACQFYRAILKPTTTPVEEAVETMSAPMNPVTLKAVPPAEPSRETNQLIHLALQEKYIGPDTGYAAGVSDQSLADDLKVPRAWVTKIRDAFFGPDINEKIVAEAKTMRAQVDELMGAAQRLADRMLEIERKVGIRS